MPPGNRLAAWLREHAGLPDAGGRRRPRRHEIELVDLDDEWTHRAPLIVDKRPLTRLHDVRQRILAALLGEQATEPAQFDVRLFLDGRLASGRAFRRSERLHYQVLLGSEAGGPSIDIKDEVYSLSLTQLAEIKRRINAGSSVHDLQYLISGMLNHATRETYLNPYQIELRAVGGLRPGSIPGRDWHVGTVASTWFCQKLCIRVRPRNQQIIINAFNNQEYIFSRPKFDQKGTVSAKTVRNWFLRRVVLTIDGSNSQGWVVERRLIICRGVYGTDVHDWSRVHGGETIYITLPPNITAWYTEAEAPFLPPLHPCVVCGDNKRPSEMPARITQACEHEVESCKACVEEWVASSLEVAWDRMRCPQCPNRLAFLDVAALADKATFERYEY
ncbi:hypothetical protein Micbo1qcDRAFT_204121 [Microdochium bolleyi]|uniref:RING-type domain-containing protein n=1 Tax=Microdochium bolleyi TaxID=196109 RepID=A0A136J4E9_9PEZI|nr:hypothetical protein Micbo1qcDRAFT_204121 [Microdochium bolleyi]